MANFWTQPNNYLLASLEENIPLEQGDVTFPLVLDPTLSVTLISGELPPGTYISGTQLLGTPAEVVRTTTYTCVLRASNGSSVSDKTFQIKVSGPDMPEWITPAGLLPVGPGLPPGITLPLFILDNEIIDFQLEVEDPDLVAGDSLIFYIEPGFGELPPGITLSEDGRLTGVVEPILALDKIASSGGYDTVKYDSYPMDFVIPSTSGFSSFFYDTQPFGFSLPNQLPKKLNRYYEFAVTVADKVSTPVKRYFQIYVVGDDFIKDVKEDIENAAFEAGEVIDPDELEEHLGGVFSADFTFIRKPVWITPADLGFVRADNYATIYLDTLKTTTLASVISYTMVPYNPDGSPSELPPGVQLDSTSGEITGYIPGQSAITQEYKFTVRATRFNIGGSVNPSTDKTFTLKVLGEIDSVITWNTDPDLGSINADVPSFITVSATTTVPNSSMLYRVVDGELPHGLRLSYKGELIGKPSLSACDCTNHGEPGVFKFAVEATDRFKFSASVREFTIKIVNPSNKLYSNLYLRPFLSQDLRLEYTNFVGNPEVFPHSSIYRPNDPYFGVQSTISVLAYAGIERASVAKYAAATAKNHKRRQYRIGNIKRAVAKHPGSNTIEYEIIYAEVIDPAEAVYGTTKESFGIKNTRGITADASAYDVLDAPGDAPYSEDDPWRLRFHPVNSEITADNTGVILNYTPDSTRFLSNTSNMRKQIERISISETVNGETTTSPARIEREYMPLWMRTGQDGSLNELGFVLAIPLVYCKPGHSKDILLNVNNALKNSTFTFSDIDLTFDRYVLDKSKEDENEQYILFANFQYNE